jgi:hypothetical protein
MCSRLVSPSNPPYAMRYPPGDFATEGDSAPYESVSPLAPGLSAAPRGCHVPPGGRIAATIREVVPSHPVYHIRMVPSASSTTDGRSARRLSGAPSVRGRGTSPSRTHPTAESPDCRARIDIYPLPAEASSGCLRLAMTWSTTP